jgi:CHASE2 domain-containing sensor protein
LLSVALELGVVRHIPLVMGLGDKLVPGLPMEMLRLATGSSAIDVFADTAGMYAVSVADVEVPTQPDGNIWLHFARMKSSLGRYVSARDVLSGNVDPDRFRDKLILVGLTGAGLTDMRTTALGELVPGIEIQAQVIETIFEGRFLRRPGWLKLAEFAVTMLLGLLLIWYVPRTDSRLVHFIRTVPKSFAILGLTLNLLLVSVSFLLFRTLGLLADAASIFIILSALMGSFFTAALLHVSDQTAPRTKLAPAGRMGTEGTDVAGAAAGADKAPGP